MALIDEAKSSGADYALTPEMTNILALKREQLFATIVAEEQDPTLATLREVARKSSTFIHIGSLAIKASPDKAVNRSFLIDRKGEIAARYDKIHMFDVDLAGGESYREFNNYRAGDLAVDRRSAVGAAWASRSATTCVSRRSIARSPKPARRFWPFRRPSPNRPAKRIGTFCSARAPSKTAASCSQPPKAAGMRTAATPIGHSLVVDPWGRVLAEGGTEPGVVMAEIDPAAGRCGARQSALAASRPAFRTGRADGRADLPARRAGADMIRYALHCDRGHAFESWFQNSAAYDKQAKTQARELSGLRFGESREGHDGAKCRAKFCLTRLCLAKLCGRRRRAAAPRHPASSDSRARAAAHRQSSGGDGVGGRNASYGRSSRKSATTSPRMQAMSAPRFPEEARKIHYGETEHRSIYGEASPDEAKELHEEGIEFHPLPILPDDQN